MLAIISPSKTLDFETPTSGKFTNAYFTSDSNILINTLKSLSKDDISRLMGISHKLTELNYQRYHEFSTPFTAKNARQAGYAFKGDVYEGLDFDSLKKDEVEYAQEHLRMLSGLYGLLRPLDLIQPYRLEMGTKLKNPHGKNLYEFWGDKITHRLNEDLSKQTLVNLASNEYWKAVNPKLIKSKIITPVFKEYKNGKYVMIALFAKKARGLMSRYIIKNKITDLSDLKEFDYAGYSYSENLSTDTKPVFVR